MTSGFLLVFRRKDNWGNVKSPRPHLTTRNGWAATQAVPTELGTGPCGQKEFSSVDRHSERPHPQPPPPETQPSPVETHELCILTHGSLTFGSRLEANLRLPGSLLWDYEKLDGERHNLPFSGFLILAITSSDPRKHLPDELSQAWASLRP